jgi:hypothetical protein
MNRSDLRTRVRTLTNIFSTALLSDAQINTVLSEVHLEICSGKQWPFLWSSTTLSVVAGDATYTLPADVSAVLMVSSKDVATVPRTLNAISVFDADTMPETYLNAWTLFYTVEGTTLTLYPEPVGDETLTVRYLETPPDFDSDDDIPPFSAEFHPVYAYAAAARILAERGASQTKVRSMIDLASTYVERMRRFYLTSSDHATVSLGKRRRWGW